MQILNNMSLLRQTLFLFTVVLLLAVSCSDELVPPESGTTPDPEVTDTVPGDTGDGGEQPPDDDPSDGSDSGENGDTGDDPAEIGMYFPPGGQNDWKTLDADSLGWNTTELNALTGFLESSKTRAFLVLYRGHMVIEFYNGLNDWDTKAETVEFDENSRWYWASAGKSLTSFLAGIAQDKGLLDISNKTSVYLGDSWSSVPPDKQELITVKDHLSMTTGLDERVQDDTPDDRVDDDCTEPECLQYRVDAGTRWMYHNAPYNLLDEIIASASGNTYGDFSATYLENPIGMMGEWRIEEEYNTIYWSTARDAARFGLLMLNNGAWNGNPILGDDDYFNAMISTSQNENPAYGLLWWLNKEGPKVQGSGRFSADFYTPNAPAQMFSAVGLNGQIINVVPEIDLVVVRFGELDNTNEKALNDAIWKYLKAVLPGG